MMGFQRRTVLQLILLVVCFGAFWLVFKQLNASRDDRTLAALATLPPSQAQQLPPQPDFALPPIEKFDVILARPLFSPDRRPVEEQEPARPIVVSAPSPLAITLKGVIVDGPERLAIFVDKKRKTIVSMKENDQFQGWTLTKVEPQQVTFSHQQVESQLFLEFDKK